MRHIVIVGGGYAGFAAVRRLERTLRRGEARVTVVGPRPSMTYQPFLPEVASGSVEARHATVPLRPHLRRTQVVAGTVTRIDHATHTVTVRPRDGRPFPLPYDVVLVTAGAVTRRLPVPGLAEHAIGLKHVEEAVAIRDHVLTAFDRAAALPPGPERRRLLTVTFVGGGFSGIEGFGETLALASDLLRSYPEIGADEVAFHLVEARDRILPEVSAPRGAWVVRHLEGRGARVHLGALVRSAVGGHVVLSTGEEYDSGLVVWVAGNDPNPVVREHTDLPLTDRGLVRVLPDLRVVREDGAVVPDAWAAGDDAAVPDLASSRPGALTVPNAQHAVRQGRRVADNVVAVLRGRAPRDYVHRSLGVIATLGRHRGIVEYRRLAITGLPAWLLHRGFHVLALPTWERTLRVLLVWAGAALAGRDTASLAPVADPRRAFLTGGAPDPSPSVTALPGHTRDLADAA